jgi:hypothetical protein
MNPADEISQALRRQVLANDRKIAAERKLSTYLDHSQASANDDRGGRFAVRSPTTVVGAAPIAYPTQPPTAPSNQMAMMPPEPSIDGTGEGLTLGYGIDRPDAPPSEPSGDGGLRRRGWRRL